VCAPLQVLAFVPAPNTVAVPTDVVFRITFDDYPDPDTVRSDSILLTTGYFWVPGAYGVDLIGKAAVMRPIRWLSPQLGYALHLRPALGSLAGCPGTSEDVDFITGDGPAGQAPADPAPFSDVQAVLDARCRDCHLTAGEGDGGCLAAPAGGLSLCGRDAWDVLVGVPSRQSGGLRLVEPGDSARSYLLRKLLPANPSGAPIPGVVGQREPPGEPLPEDQLRLIASWIDGGALR
jgi:Bacterial Ig-like domain